jgi:hypothetical protein
LGVRTAWATLIAHSSIANTASMCSDVMFDYGRRG